MAQLPPKIPTMSSQPTWPPAFPPHHRMPPLTTITPTTTTTTAAAAPASWVDEFLDFTSSRRGSHRRSVSDSIAFLEAAATTPLVIDDCIRSSLHGGGGHATGFDRIDDEQLMSMFSDDFAGGMTGIVGAPSSPSDQNSNNEEDPLSVDDNNKVPKSEPGEVESSCKSEDLVANAAAPPFSDTVADQASGDDPIIDPKRVKRILANRQSAQRSRVRKLQYISELERSVTTLQTEVSALSPRVAFLDHQRLILNVDNSALKQRIAALAQDKIFKDAHQEALKKEVERLRQIYQQQQQQQQSLKKMGNCNNHNNINNNSSNSPHQPSSDHNMGCTDKEQLMT